MHDAEFKYPHLFPVSLVLTGRRVVVAGTGVLAAEKVALLLDAGAEVTVVGPEPPVPALATAIESRRVRLLAREFVPADLDAAAIVFAAAGKREHNAAVRRAAHARGLLVNAVDDPESCDLMMPAVARRGPVSIAVSSAGIAPAFAARLARELADGLGDTLTEYVALLHAAREEIRRRYPDDFAMRRVLNARVLDCPARELLRRGDGDAARAAMWRVLDEAGAAGQRAT